MNDKFPVENDEKTLENYGETVELTEEYCGEACFKCDCEACRAYYDEHGETPDMDCCAGEDVCCKCDDCELLADEKPSLAEQLSDFKDGLYENMLNPPEKQRVSAKTLYITLGVTAAASILLFLLLGWLLCYCPLKTMDLTEDEFIREYNSIVSYSDLIELIDGQVSGTDIQPCYPDFDSLFIPEDADLDKGVELMDGRFLLKGDVKGGKIASLSIAFVPDEEVSYDFASYDFVRNDGVEVDSRADYRNLAYYAAVGKMMLVMDKYNARLTGAETQSFTVLDAAGSFAGIIDYVLSYYYQTGMQVPSLNDDKTIENVRQFVDLENFGYSVEVIQKTLIQPDNGIYRFFDSIFGEKEAEVEQPQPENNSAVSDSSVSAADVSGTDTSGADAA